MGTLREAMTEFKGQLVFVRAMPSTFESSSFARQLFVVLKSAGVNTHWREGPMMETGNARGVVAHFVTGNTKGAQFAQALTDHLTSLGIDATAAPGMLERLMPSLEQQHGADWRQRDGNASVLVTVGDKP